MLQKEIPFLRLVVPFAAGIILSDLLVIPKAILIILFLLSIILIAISLLTAGRGASIFFGLSNTPLLLLLGYFSYYQQYNNYSLLPSGERYITCRVRDYPSMAGTRFKFEADISSVSDENSIADASGGILVYIQPDNIPSIIPGNELQLKIKPLPIINSGNPGSFNYARYMRTAGIAYYAFADSTAFLSCNTAGKLTLGERALLTREKMIESLKQKLKGRNHAIVTALFLGQREYLEEDQLDAFSGSGAMHVMAVSGLHAGIISMVAFSALFFLKGRLRFLRIVLTITILWGFAYLTGLSPSVRRASIMFSLFHAGDLMKRPVNSVNTLLVSAFIILLSEPGQLFSSGFQMSYLAVLSIILFFQKLNSLFIPGSRLLRYFWSLGVVSLLAQGATAAVSVAAFNRFPSWFLLTNMAVIPLAFLLLTSAVAAFLFSPLPIASALFMKIAGLAASGLEQVTQFISTLPGAVVEDIGLTTRGIWLLTLLFFITVDLLLNRKERSLLFWLITILLLFSTDTVIKSLNTRRTELVAYSSSTDHDLAVVSNGTIHLIKYGDTVGREALKHSYHAAMPLIEYNVGDEDRLIQTGNISCLITDDPAVTEKPPPFVDIIYYRGSIRLTTIPEGPPHRIILLTRQSLLPYGYSSSGSVNLHSLREDGCFRYKPGGENDLTLFP